MTTSNEMATFLPPFGSGNGTTSTSTQFTIAIDAHWSVCWSIPSVSQSSGGVLLGHHIVDPSGDAVVFTIADNLPSTGNYTWQPSEDREVSQSDGGTYFLSFSIANIPDFDSFFFEVGPLPASAIPTSTTSSPVTTASPFPSTIAAASSVPTKETLPAATTLPAKGGTPNSDGALGTAAVVGIVIGTVVGSLILLTAFLLCFRRHLLRSLREAQVAPQASKSVSSSKATSMLVSKKELPPLPPESIISPISPQNGRHAYHEFDSPSPARELGAGLPHEMDANQVNELPT